MGHAIMHYMYASIWHMLMIDQGVIYPCVGREPFKNIITQGMVLLDHAKRSKSKGNRVDPMTQVDMYGSIRMNFNWDEQGIVGCFRCLTRLVDRLFRATFIDHHHHQHLEGSVSTEDINQEMQLCIGFFDS